MKKQLIAAMLLLAFNNAIGQLSADSVIAIIGREVSARRSKSIIVGLIDSNGRRQIFAAGKLSDANPVLPDANTIYEIGSITKVFTTLVLADMSLKKQLNLNDPISKYLPKTVKTPVTNGKEISLMSLATHLSGFPRFPYNTDPADPDNSYADYTLQQLYDYIAAFKPPFEIGSRWKYSNIGFGLLGEILTGITHRNFETLIRQQICEPLKMKRTVVTLTPALLKNTAIGHAETGTPVNFLKLPVLEAAGIYRSDVNDMLTFAAANLGLISTSLYPAMQLTHIEQAKKNDADGYTTMGWTLFNDKGREIIFKDGGTPGYRTFVGIDKKNKSGVVVFSNSNNGVTDIGLHVIDPGYKLSPYKYPWNLLDTLRVVVKTTGTDAAMTLYDQLKSGRDTAFIFNEYQLNYLGNELRQQHKSADAIKIFELNIREYPASPLVYESLGEIYKRNHDTTRAIQLFEKARELEPENLHWDYMLERLKKK